MRKTGFTNEYFYYLYNPGVDKRRILLKVILCNLTNLTKTGENQGKKMKIKEYLT